LTDFGVNGYVLSVDQAGRWPTAVLRLLADDLTGAQPHVQGAGLGVGDRLVHLRGRGPFDGGDVLGGERTVGQALLGERDDGITLPPSRDFRLVPVKLRIEHRVRPEPIGAELQEERTGPGAHVRHRLFHRRPAGHHVHPVGTGGGYPVRLGQHAEVDVGELPFDRGAHRVTVVLAAEQHRQLPQLSHVHGLVEGPLGDRALPEVAGGHPVTAELFVGEGQTGGGRQSAGDDRIAAVEPPPGVEQVHRPATPARTALLPAEHLGHDRRHRDAPHERVGVLAVRRDDGIIAVEYA